MEGELGMSKVSVYFFKVTEEQLEAVMDDFADALAARGLADAEEVFTVMTAEPFDLPDEETTEEMFQRIAGPPVSVLMVPRAEEGNDEVQDIR